MLRRALQGLWCSGLALLFLGAAVWAAEDEKAEPPPLDGADIPLTPGLMLEALEQVNNNPEMQRLLRDRIIKQRQAAEVGSLQQQLLDYYALVLDQVTFRPPPRDEEMISLAAELPPIVPTWMTPHELQDLFSFLRGFVPYKPDEVAEKAFELLFTKGGQSAYFFQLAALSLRQVNPQPELREKIHQAIAYDAERLENNPSLLWLSEQRLLITARLILLIELWQKGLNTESSPQDLRWLFDRAPTLATLEMLQVVGRYLRIMNPEELSAAYLKRLGELQTLLRTLRREGGPAAMESTPQGRIDLAARAAFYKLENVPGRMMSSDFSHARITSLEETIGYWNALHYALELPDLEPWQRAKLIETAGYLIQPLRRPFTTGEKGVENWTRPRLEEAIINRVIEYAARADGEMLTAALQVLAGPGYHLLGEPKEIMLHPVSERFLQPNARQRLNGQQRFLLLVLTAEGKPAWRQALHPISWVKPNLHQHLLKEGVAPDTIPPWKLHEVVQDNPRRCGTLAKIAKDLARSRRAPAEELHEFAEKFALMARVKTGYFVPESVNASLFIHAKLNKMRGAETKPILCRPVP